MKYFKYLKNTVLFILFLPISGNNYSNESQTVDFEPRIVGGTPAKIEDVPYQVSLHTISRGLICGGSLVKLDHILTAAHCLISKYGVKIRRKNLLICAGTNFASNCALSRSVEAIYVHHKFKRGLRVDHDIAVVKVKEPFDETKFVKVIPLAMLPPNDGEMCVISGWGSLKHGSAISSVLMRASLPIVNYQTCEIQNSQIYLGIYVICAGFDKGGVDACQGDSGGPLACNGVLYGIVSLGLGCGNPKSPGVYTDVHKYINWIHHRFNSSSLLSHHLWIIVFVLYLFIFYFGTYSLY